MPPYLLFLTAVVLGADAKRDYGPPYESKLPFACIDGNTLLIRQFRGPDMEWMHADLGQRRVCPIAEVFPRTADALRTDIGGGSLTKGIAERNFFYQWRWAFGHIWAVSFVPTIQEDSWCYRSFGRMKFPNEKLELPSDATGPPVRPPLKRGDLRGDSRLGFSNDGGGLPTRGDLLYAVAGMEIVDALGRNARWSTTGKLRFDFDILPLAPRRLLAFVATQRDLSVWEYNFSRGRDQEEDTEDCWVGLWQRRAKLAAPFADPFHAAAAEGDYFLVTDSGAVYRVSPGKETWKIEEAWPAKPRPIVALLAPTDGGPAYVFGKDFYFKLGKKFDVKPCRDVTRKDPSATDKGLDKLEPDARLSYTCARVLYENGELKPRQKPE